MARSASRRPILKKALIAISCALALVSATMPAAAQHRVGGGGSPVPAPPVRVYAPPMRPAAPPISRAPVFVPRMPAVPLTGRMATANLQYRPRPIRPAPPIIFIYSPAFFYNWPAWGFNTCWWATCDLFWGLGYNFLPAYSYTPAMYVSAPEYEAPVYVYGEERPEYPQLYLKDGTVYNVTDYWLIDDQLHFTMIEGDLTRPTERVIGFDQLDVPKTANADTQRGFRFVLRNEPIDQYLRDHPDGNPSDRTAPQK